MALNAEDQVQSCAELFRNIHGAHLDERQTDAARKSRRARRQRTTDEPTIAIRNRPNPCRKASKSQWSAIVGCSVFLGLGFLGSLLTDAPVQEAIGEKVQVLAAPFTIETELENAVAVLLNHSESYRPRLALPSGRYRVEVSASGSQVAMAEVEHGRSPTIRQITLLQEVTPVPILEAPALEKAMFAVGTEPASARVALLNTRERYRRGMFLASGTYQTEVSKPGYATSRVRLQHGGDCPHRMVRERTNSSLTVETVPNDAKVVLLGRGESYHPGMALVSGDYRVEISASGYRTVVKRIQHGNSPTRVHVESKLLEGSAQPLHTGVACQRRAAPVRDPDGHRSLSGLRLRDLAVRS